MKALLLKDWYMAVRYCRMYPVIVALFAVLSYSGEGSDFNLFYPALLCGMIPVNLIAYDERSRWSCYGDTMPFTRGQTVCAKYLFGLLAQAAAAVVMAAVQGVRMVQDNVFSWLPILLSFATAMALALFASGFCLPFVFKLGAEKGRIAYLVAVALGAVLVALLPALVGQAFLVASPVVQSFALLAAGAAVYLLSMGLSVRFYRKREL